MCHSVFEIFFEHTINRRYLQRVYQCSDNLLFRMRSQSYCETKQMMINMCKQIIKWTLVSKNIKCLYALKCFPGSSLTKKLHVLNVKYYYDRHINTMDFIDHWIMELYCIQYRDWIESTFKIWNVPSQIQMYNSLYKYVVIKLTKWKFAHPAKGYKRQ